MSDSRDVELDREHRSARLIAADDLDQRPTHSENINSVGAIEVDIDAEPAE
ncbi:MULTISPECIES: hypothetical protein [Nocardia]|uniref:hypothetical protein n=1 Tax=Nocardia TaxID=1817 RepID=UPI0024559C24|nr:hypothetical protein [Nocardia brasiliensis]